MRENMRRQLRYVKDFNKISSTMAILQRLQTCNPHQCESAGDCNL